MLSRPVLARTSGLKPSHVGDPRGWCTDWPKSPSISAESTQPAWDESLLPTRPRIALVPASF
jgi:hypothetical protein